MRFCSKCGFILGTRPGLKERDGVCLACINNDNKKRVDFKERQRWLSAVIRDWHKAHPFAKYDCLIAVSGGKDSHMIVKRLMTKHGIRNPLLVTVTDEFTHTKAGQHNINNLVMRYDLDHITFRCKPMTFRRETKKDFERELHPLKWIEEKIYSVPIDIAKKYNIEFIFYGENSAYEYGTDETLSIFHPASTPALNVIYMGAIYPYSIKDSLKEARSIGFKDLDDFREWPRKGSVDQYTQIDSVAYIIQLWTKFVKFGFQRVSDVACRFVREGTWTKAQAEKAIREKDYICDPMAKADFCKTIGITEKYFDKIVDKHANHKLVEKDKAGNWRLKNV